MPDIRLKLFAFARFAERIIAEHQTEALHRPWLDERVTLIAPIEESDATLP